MKNILVIYGSTTGNSEEVSYYCESILKNNFTISVKNCEDLGSKYNFTDKFDVYIVCTSTWGIDPAEMQEDFEIFWNKINNESLKDKKFILLGLGDDYYPFFAKAIDILYEDILQNQGIVLDTPLKIKDPWEDNRSIIMEYLKKTLLKYKKFSTILQY